MADMTAEQLLPCPFCGRSDALCILWASDSSDWDNSNEDTCQVYCDASGASGPAGCGGSCGAALTEEAVRAKWNTRPSGMAAVPAWQPIETAPKDGQDYIASDGRLRTIENQPQGCMPGRWSKGTDGRWSGYANRPIGYAPKYWYPMPAAPEVPGHG